VKEREEQQEEERREKEKMAVEKMKELEGRLKGLEIAVTGSKGSTEGEERGRHIGEMRQRIEEMERMAQEVRSEKECAMEEKVRILEEGLEKEKKDRERLEKERKEDFCKRERLESIKEMERKVSDSMDTLKILNLKFRKASNEKGDLLKEAEGTIKGKVGVQDRSECECILRRSKVYILGKGTGEKIVNGERIFTAPVLLKCGSQIEKERMERMLRRAGVHLAFHWPKELMDFVYDIRRKVDQLGYREDEYHVKVRPFKLDGVPQLRAEVKKIVGRGGSFERVGCWSCPPVDRRLW
jgi:hypothetical protein